MAEEDLKPEKALKPENMDGSGGTSGEVPQTDGTNISWASVGGGVWSKIGTANLTDQTSGTVSWSTNYGSILVIFSVNGTANLNEVGLRIKGETGSQYDWLNNSGTRTTGETYYPVGAREPRVWGTPVFISGRHDTRTPTLRNPPCSDFPKAVAARVNNQTSGAVNQVTVVNPNGNNLTITMEVFGR